MQWRGRKEVITSHIKNDFDWQEKKEKKRIEDRIKWFFSRSFRYFQRALECVDDVIFWNRSASHGVLGEGVFYDDILFKRQRKQREHMFYKEYKSMYNAQNK